MDGDDKLMDTYFHILSTNLTLLQLLADTIDAGEGYPIPGGLTEHHAVPETRHDGNEYALLADDVAAKYLAALVAAVVEDGDAGQVAADWQALQAGEIAEMAYSIEAGPFAGVSVRVGVKPAEWTPPPDVMGG